MGEVTYGAKVPEELKAQLEQLKEIKTELDNANLKILNLSSDINNKDGKI